MASKPAAYNQTKPTPPEPGTAVAERREGGALATAEDIAALGAFAGFDDIGRDDVAIPFLIILQSNSPQLEPGNAQYIEGARQGEILQTVTKERRQSLLVVVADYKRSFIEWVPRVKGGGFRGETGKESETLFNARLNRETGKARLENGNDLSDTRSFFVLTSDQTEEGTPAIAPAMVSMASTQVKVAKGWMNLLLNYVPPGQKPGKFPPWAAIYKLSTVINKNEKGTWHGWRVERVGFNRIPELRDAAAAFHQQIRAGVVKVDRSAMEQEQTDGAEPQPNDGKF